MGIVDDCYIEAWSAIAMAFNASGDLGPFTNS